MKAMKISFENNKNSVNFAATLDDPQTHIFPIITITASLGDI